MKIFASVNPKVNERGIWAKLRGCFTSSSKVISDYCSLTKGLRTSRRAMMAPLRMQSMTLPSSQITLAYTSIFQIYRPERMQSDSGSNAFDPTITVYNNLAASAESFLFYSTFPWQLWQSTLKKMMPSLGLSVLGAVIYTLVLMETYVVPIRKRRWPEYELMHLFEEENELNILLVGMAIDHRCASCAPSNDEYISLGSA